MRKKTEVIKPWIYQGQEVVDLDQEILDSQYGFIYCITSNITGQKYIGKKNLHSYKTVKSQKLNEKTGRMNKVKTVLVSESDWRKYFGSSLEIKQLVKEQGKENFTREILRFVESKKLLTYYELREPCARDVLEPNSGYLNTNILDKFFTSDWNTNKLKDQELC